MFEYISANLGSFIIPPSILIGTVIVALIFNWVFDRFIKRATKAMDNDPTNYQFLRHFISALIYIIGIGLAIYFIPSLRAMAHSMLAGAGILALAIGLASQQALSNIVSGIFIVIFKPFKVHDRLIIKTDLGGVVEDITLRHTVIRNYENRRIVIPNSVISSEVVINSDYEEEKICNRLDFQIAYDADVQKAREIIQAEVENHPDHLDNRSIEDIEAGAPLVRVRLISMNESSVTLRAWAWAKDSSTAYAMGCDLLESVKKQFSLNGIEIPFPHRKVILENRPSNKE